MESNSFNTESQTKSPGFSINQTIAQLVFSVDLQMSCGEKDVSTATDEGTMVEIIRYFLTLFAFMESDPSTL